MALVSVALVWWGLLFAPVPGAASHEALLIEVDRTRFVLETRDLRDRSAGPSFRVVLGSPSHPTPTGDFPIYRVVRNPGWQPGPTARARGATESRPAVDGPMGVAKLPFAPGGIALHGGADPLLLGKPISLGCIRARDRDLATLLAWLAERGALAEPGPQTPPLQYSPRGGGEAPEALKLALRIRIR